MRSDPHPPQPGPHECGFSPPVGFSRAIRAGCDRERPSVIRREVGIPASRPGTELVERHTNVLGHADRALTFQVHTRRPLALMAKPARCERDRQVSDAHTYSGGTAGYAIDDRNAPQAGALSVESEGQPPPHRRAPDRVRQGSLLEASLSGCGRSCCSRAAVAPRIVFAALAARG